MTDLMQEEELKEFISNRVNELLLENHFTQRTLSRRSGITYMTIWRIVHNHDKYIPAVSTLLAIANGFDISMSEFFKGV
jgi:transcriptional regulator with XRE-family HTH domain